MIEKIKNKIDQNKKDKATFKEYIKSFCESKKAQELYENNEDFIKISKSTKKEKEEY